MTEEIGKGGNWYDKSYKILLLIPVLIFIVSLIYLFGFYQTNGDIILKDVSLTGGTSITVFDENVRFSEIKDSLKSEFPDIAARGISDIRTGKQHGFTIESQQEAGVLKQALERKLGYNLTEENSSIEFSGSSLSSGFYQQLQNSIIAAFLLMAIVVFIIFGDSKRLKLISVMITAIVLSILFKNITLLSYSAVFAFAISFIWYFFKGMHKGRKYGYIELMALAFMGILLLQRELIGILMPGVSGLSDYIFVIPLIIVLIGLYFISSVPSIAVMFAAFADIIMTVAVVDILGIQLSVAGIVAFLMLIGFSVDTDILLTSRLLRNREGSTNERIRGAFKTGITMTLTAIASVAASLIIIYSFSETLKQIFGILLIGLSFDILNTWLTNASILKWYVEVKNK